MYIYIYIYPMCSLCSNKIVMFEGYETTIYPWDPWGYSPDSLAACTGHPYPWCVRLFLVRASDVPRDRYTS